MFYKLNELKPYKIGNTVCFSKIIKIHTNTNRYTIQDLETKKKHILNEKDIYICFQFSK